MTHLKNIEKVLAHADEIDIREGKLAYQWHHNTLRNISHHYGSGFVQTCAAFSALSPNNDQMGNYRSLISTLEGIKKGIECKDITISTYNACRDRAYSYIIGDKDFLMETKGKKTIAFYHNIVKPECKQHITIDGHMFSIYNGQRMTMKEVAGLRFSYDEVSSAFKKVASCHNLIPNQLQAILWFTWKRIHNVLYQPQISYLNKDHWKIQMELSEIVPYPCKNGKLC